MKKYLIALALCLLSLAVHADLREQAKQAAVADAATTAVGLAAGAAEMNPVGPIVAVAIKPLVLRYISSLPEEQQASAHAAVSSVWGGAAANNLCVIVSILTSGGFGPVCVAVGVAWGWKTWKDSEPERIFWEEGCPMLRQFAGDPDMQCIYRPVARAE